MAWRPAGCQYSVTAVDLRGLEPVDVLKRYPHSLLLRVSGITEGGTGGLSQVHEQSIPGPRPAAGPTRRELRSVSTA